MKRFREPLPSIRHSVSGNPGSVARHERSLRAVLRYLLTCVAVPVMRGSADGGRRRVPRRPFASTRGRLPTMDAVASVRTSRSRAPRQVTRVRCARRVRAQRVRRSSPPRPYPRRSARQPRRRDVRVGVRHHAVHRALPTVRRPPPRARLLSHPEVTAPILAHLGIASTIPPLAPARAPPDQLDLSWS